MPQGIIILGLNGSGKSTLARITAGRLGFQALDIENYFFEPAQIPYSHPRSREACYAALLADIRSGGNFVLAHVRGDCGAEINAMYAFAVLLSAPVEVRMARIRSRALERFGKRVLPGGDLYEQEEGFFRMAAGRTEEPLERFLQSLSCPILRLDATSSIPELAEQVVTGYSQTLPSKRQKGSFL